MISAPKSIWNFDPRSVAGCHLWLDASDSSTITLSSGNMTQWRDKSDRGNTMTPFSTFSNATVTSNFQNGLNVLNFSGAGVYQSVVTSGGVYPIDLYIILALKDTTTHVDVVTVYSSNAGSTFNSLTFGEHTASRWHNDSDGFARTPNTVTPSNETSTSLLLLNWSISNNNFIIRRLGTQISQTASYTYTFPSDSRFQVGYRVNPTVFSPATTAGPFRGYIGEIVAFDRQLGSTEREQIEGFLAWKWNISPSYNKNFPRTISGCELWFDGGDSTTMFQNTAGTTPVTAAAQSVACWKDKIRNLSLTDTGIDGRASVAPSSVSGGGLLFNNVNASPSSSTQSLGAFSSGATNQTSYLFRMPTKSMTLFITSLPLSNNGYRRICLMGSYPLSGGPPNFLIGPEMGASEGGTILIDLNSGMSAWGQQLDTNSGYNSNAVLRIDTMTVDTTGSWFTNGIANTPTTNTSYTSANTNYPVNFIYFAGYSSTIDGGRSFNGTIFEMLLYSKVLTTLERQQVEGYLARKWNITAVYTRLPTTHQFYSIRPFLRRFNPIDIDGCQLWLDAADASTLTFSSGSNVSSWIDKSTNVSSTTSVAGTNVLTQNAMNRCPAILLNGSSSFTGSTTGSGNTLTVCIVATQSNTCATNGGLVCFGRPGFDDWNDIGSLSITNFVGIGSGQMGSTRTANSQTVNTGVSTPFIYILVFDGTFVNSYLNGIIQTPTNISLTGTFAYTGYKIGNRAGATVNVFWTGFIGEILVFNTALTTSQRQQVEGYLAYKWGLISPLPATHSYKKLSPSSALPFLPTNISGCSLWLDGADPAGTGVQPANGSTVSTWVDKSGNGRNAAANVGGGAITMGTLKNVPAITFPAASTAAFILPASLSVGTNGYSVFFVANQTAFASGETRMYSANGGGIQSIVLNAPSPRILTVYNGSNMSTGFTVIANTPFLYSYTISSTAAGLLKNGNLEGVSGGASTAVTNFYIGNYSGVSALYAFTGQMCEFLIYNTALTTSERQRVEGYLAEKWGLKSSLPSLHPYRNFPPPQKSLIIPSTIASVTLSGLSGAGGTISWTTSTNAVSYKWFVGTTFPTSLVSGTVGAVLTASVSYAFAGSTNYFGWVTPVSSTGTDGATTISSAASYSAGGGSDITSTNLNTIATYLRSYMSEFRNPSFYGYNLDGTSYYIGDGGGDMYDNGNMTYPWLISGTQFTTANINQQAFSINYSATTATTVDTDFIYASLGYIQGSGISSIHPLTVLGFRSTVGRPVGFQLAGNSGADGGGTLASGIVYAGATLSGFTVHAFFRETYNAGDPSHCNLFILLGHTNWGSVFGTISSFADPVSNGGNGAYFFTSGGGVKNILAVQTLLSKSGGALVSAAECQTVVEAFANRIKLALGF